MKDFINNINLLYGEKGGNWLTNFPNLISDLAKQWNLRDLLPCEDLSYNYVLSGWQKEIPIILKLGCNLNAIQKESSAALAFCGHGIVKILNADFGKGAILLARAIPGKTLVTLFPQQDKTALEIACKLISTLHKAQIPIDHTFPLLSEWLSFIDQDWDLPIEQLQLARNLKTELLNNSQTNMLLHGDMHYANILSDGDDWVVIDPKGVIGDPLYDMTGCLLREPFKQLMLLTDISGMLKNRMKFVAQYNKCDVQQIWKWTYVQTVMSICWSLEDGQEVTLKRKFLHILEAL